jgi:hypothetical protein
MHQEAVENRSTRLTLDGWPCPELRSDESVAVRARELAHAVRRWLTAGPRIHVSPMSVAWLRLHEVQYDKHGAGL